jgi:hypothetical protein
MGLTNRNSGKGGKDMSLQIDYVSDEQVSSLVHEMNTRGYGFITNYIQPDDLRRMENFVDRAIRKSNNEYVHFNGPSAVTGSGLEELSESAAFHDLMERLYREGTGLTPPKQNFYQVLRCLSGQGGQKHSYYFHYDSYLVTALIPIRIPRSGRAGDLLMLPNTRKVRKTYLLNALDKVVIHNPLTQAVLRKKAISNRLALTRVKLSPGSIYFFWGYRSVHANEPCDPDKVRATALFHYAHPHKKTPETMPAAM